MYHVSSKYGNKIIIMKCKMCPNDAGKKKTCSRSCLIKLRSLNGTKSNQEKRGFSAYWDKQLNWYKKHKQGISRSWNDRNR